MTKNEFRKACEDPRVIWAKYSGKLKTFFVCCKDSIVGEELLELSKGSHFAVRIG